MGLESRFYKVVYVFFFFIVVNFDSGIFSLMRCDFCGVGFDIRVGFFSYVRVYLRDFGIINWEFIVLFINVL